MRQPVGGGLPGWALAARCSSALLGWLAPRAVVRDPGARAREYLTVRIPRPSAVLSAARRQLGAVPAGRPRGAGVAIPLLRAVGVPGMFPVAVAGASGASLPRRRRRPPRHGAGASRRRQHRRHPPVGHAHRRAPRLRRGGQPRRRRQPLTAASHLVKSAPVALGMGLTKWGFGMSKRGRPAAIGLGMSVLVALAGAPAQGAVPAGPGEREHPVPEREPRPGAGPRHPRLRRNPADPRHVVMITEEFITGQCDFHTSFDGGRTWANEGHLTVPTDFADPPCLTYDSGGYAHFNKSVVWGTGQNVYTTFASHRGPRAAARDRHRRRRGRLGHRQPLDRRRPHLGARRRRHPGRPRLPAVHHPPGHRRPAPAPGRQALRRRLVRREPAEHGRPGRAGRAPDRRRQLRGRRQDMVRPGLRRGPRREGPRDHPAGGRARTAPSTCAWRNRDDPAAAPHPIVVAKSSDGGVTWTRTPIQDATPAPTGTPPRPATPASRRWPSTPTRTGQPVRHLPRLQLRRPRHPRPALHRQRRHLVAAGAGQRRPPSATACAS